MGIQKKYKFRNYEPSSIARAILTLVSALPIFVAIVRPLMYLLKILSRGKAMNNLALSHVLIEISICIIVIVLMVFVISGIDFMMQKKKQN